jgi:phosphotransferase system  glucose/maltose/N-acetylglucosamine-specific IIC component
MTQAIMSGAAIGALYVLMSIGFALSLEIADIVNAAHGTFVVGAMYLTLTLVRAGWSLSLAIAAAGVVVGALSWPLCTLLIRSARSERGHRMAPGGVKFDQNQNNTLLQVKPDGGYNTVYPKDFASAPLAPYQTQP